MEEAGANALALEVRARAATRYFIVICNLFEQDASAVKWGFKTSKLQRRIEFLASSGGRQKIARSAIDAIMTFCHRLTSSNKIDKKLRKEGNCG
jgi:hypothetical protein